jgi:excisionase family DNA binding protein
MSTYLTTQEVADRLGVSVFTIRRYIRAGQLRAIKLDGVYRIGRDDMAAFLKAREIGGAAGAAGRAHPAPPAGRA